MAVSEGGVSMLDRLSGRIVDNKAVAGSKLSPGLTPVAGEQARDLSVLPDVGAPFPYEHPTENIVTAIRAIRAKLDDIEATLVAIETTLAVPSPAAAVVPTDLNAKERAADARAAANPVAQVVDRAAERNAAREALLAAMIGAQPETFEAKFAAQQEAAQAAAFTQPPKVVPAVTGEGWSCPEHGVTLIEPKVSPRGRHFNRCAVAGCREFEK